MTTAIALRHVAFEDLGLLAPTLAKAGWNCQYRDAPTDDLADPAIENAGLLIVLGGPIGVYEVDSYPFLSREIALLERRVARGLPTLGICLGSQLLAKALGARVFPGGVKEIGWGEVVLTEAGRQSCLRPLGDKDATVLHWHGDTFDLPAGATRLARNALYENQAFGYGEKVLALQFHVEADPRRLENWFVGHTMELAAAGRSIPDFRARTIDLASRVTAQSERIFSAWLETIG